MVKTATLRGAAVVLTLSMALVACGQKEGVRRVVLEGDEGARAGVAEADFGEQGSVEGGPPAETDGNDDLDGVPQDVPGSQDAPGQQAPGTQGAPDTSGAPADNPAPTGAPSAEGSGGAGPQGGGAPQGDGGSPPAGGAAAPTNQAPQPRGGDSTGITDSVIRIGVHAPETGAAPLPSESFRRGAVQYWDHVGLVAGRRVEVLTVDDQFNPSRATQVCRQLIEQHEVFLLIGGGGADQIAACARTAANAGVPYLSAGVDEGVLRRLPNYFALSMSYVQQAPLLVQWIRAHANPSNGRVALLRDRTPSYNNVVQRLQQLLTEAGYEVLVRQVQGAASDGQWLRQNAIETAYPIMAPGTWVQIARAPGGQIDNWVGMGITMGLNQIALAGCQGNPAFDGSMFFSPWPGLNTVGDVDPAFNEAGGGDDIQWGLWGVNKTLHEVFKRMGDDLTRQSFVRTMESSPVASGVFPEQRHSADNHFGTNQVHVLQADCSRSQFVTPSGGLFQTGF